MKKESNTLSIFTAEHEHFLIGIRASNFDESTSWEDYLKVFYLDFEFYGLPYFVTIFITQSVKYELRIEQDDITLLHHKRMKSIEELIDLFQYFILNLTSN